MTDDLVKFEYEGLGTTTVAADDLLLTDIREEEEGYETGLFDLCILFGCSTFEEEDNFLINGILPPLTLLS